MNKQHQACLNELRFVNSLGVICIGSFKTSTVSRIVCDDFLDSARGAEATINWGWGPSDARSPD
jgi:hypothetical protein